MMMQRIQRMKPSPKSLESIFNIRGCVGKIQFSPTLEINECVQSARERGEELRPGAQRSVDHGQAAEGPEQDLVGLSADPAGTPAVSEFV